MKNNRILRLLRTLPALVVAAVSTCAAEILRAIKPNIVFILADDLGYASHPEIFARLTKLLEKCVAAGRSSPG